MIHVTIIGANNLPIVTKKIEKTRLIVLSSSTKRYFYGSIKNKEKTSYPLWDAEFDIDFYRANFLYLKLFASPFFKKDTFIGEAIIDLISIMNEQPQNFYGSIDQPIHRDVPITLCQADNAQISFEFYYIPSILPSLPLSDIPSSPQYHVFLTYNPPLPFSQEFQLPVEIELLQYFAIPQNKEDKKSKTSRGVYLHLDSKHDWESVGISNQYPVFGPTGYTQLISLNSERISEKALVFLFNVHNYHGIVTLNLVAEHPDKHMEYFNSNLFEVVPSKSIKKGIIQTIDVCVQENTKISLPLSLYFHQSFFSKSIETFPISQFLFSSNANNSNNSNSSNINNLDNSNNSNLNNKEIGESLILIPSNDVNSNVDSNSNINSNSNVDSNSNLITPNTSETSFYRNITIEIENNVTPFNSKSVQFIPRTVPYKEVSIPLKEQLDKINAPISYKLRFYFGGSTTVSYGQTVITHFWQPLILIFDKATGTLLQDPTENIHDSSNCRVPKNYMIDEKSPDGSIGLNLDEIGIDKIVLFTLSNTFALDAAQKPGYYYLVQDDTNEVLFRKDIYISEYASLISSFGRFEYIEDDWVFIPMKNVFMSVDKGIKKFMEMAQNKWIYPNDSIEEIIQTNYKPSNVHLVKLENESYRCLKSFKK